MVTSVWFVLYFLDVRKLSSQYVLIDGLICPYNCLLCWYALIFLIQCCAFIEQAYYTQQLINGVNCGDHCRLHFRPLSSHRVNLYMLIVAITTP